MLKRIFKFGIKLALLFIFIVALLVAGVYYGVFGHLYTKQELKDFSNDTASLVISDNGTLIGKFFKKNRTNIQYEQLPKQLVNALVATEDARYFEHEGIDSRSLLRVLFKSILLNDKSSGGGSTITQQLAKNMYGRKSYGPITMPINKTKEVILAQRLEQVYNKEEILTLYLNTVPFGENVLGIEAAARRYFNKSVEKLNIEESAVLVGILKANTYYNPRLYPEHALKRRNVVIHQMERYEYLTKEAADSLQQLELKLDYANIESEGPANYFLVEVKKEAQKLLEEVQRKKDTVYDLYKSGLVIETTLNIDLQTYALQAFKSHLGKMQKRLDKQYARGSYHKKLSALADTELKRLHQNNTTARKNRELFSWDGFYKDSISVKDSIQHQLKLLQAGLLALDPRTGAIKSWVGGIDFRTQPYDQIFAQRQTASAFKPFLYASALEVGVDPCDYLENEPIVLEDFEGWQPQNYDKSVGGNYSVAAALAKSLNIPTVNLFLQVPFQNLEKTWKNLGFSQEILNQPASALGTTTASLYEMTLAYGSFANGGYKIKPQLIKAIKTSNGEVLYQNKMLKSKEKVLAQKEALLINAMLQKAVIEGTGKSMKNVYGVQLPLAGKTGTSQDYADAWFMAYNPNLVIGARVGASFPSIHFNSGANGSGGTLALPLVAKTLQQVQKNRTLKNKFFTKFETLPEPFYGALDCEDYVDDSDIEKFLERIFKKKSTTFEQASKRAERKTKKKKKKPLFQRIFGKKEN